MRGDTEILSVDDDMAEWFKISYQGKKPLIRWVKAKNLNNED